MLCPNSFHFSLFAPVETFYTCGSFTLRLNLVVIISYLLWDLYKMVLSKEKKILYRTELFYHHIACCITSCLIMKCILISNNFLICECISICNYLLKEKHQIQNLALYRLCCIVFVRLPILCFMNYYTVFHLHKYIQYPSSSLKYELLIGTNFFFLYDMYLLRQNSKVVLGLKNEKDEKDEKDEKNEKDEKDEKDEKNK